jgi:trehalose 6-phosphate synthase
MTDEPTLPRSTPRTLPQGSAAAPTIIANRLPVAYRDGAWSISPGGLVRALLPIMRAHDGLWIGWDGRIDQGHDQPAEPFEHDGLRMVRMALTRRDHAGYYRAVSNEMLWPLFHDGVRHPTYDPKPWEAYTKVNRRFAQAAAEHTPEGGLVWVHDYHLLLVPGMLRAIRPDLRIGLFIHIPVPPRELFATLPWRDEITRSLCCADLVGTQTADDATHMRDCLACPDLTGKREAPARAPAVAAFPISIDSARFCAAAERAERDGSAAAMRTRTAGKRRTLLLGVDRLDYTKGIDKRLEAFELALGRGEIDPEAVRFVQVAVPSREAVADYKEISERVDGLVGRINGVHGGLDGPVVHYIKSGLAEEDLIPLYRAADVMVVTPLRDGMNLVAKEYVASRYDRTGQLVLSEFAGAARELKDATIVNPHDAQALADALVGACRRHAEGDAGIGPAMARMHEHVMGHDVHRWSASFLDRLRPPSTALARRADLSRVVGTPVATATRN